MAQTVHQYILTTIAKGDAAQVISLLTDAVVGTRLQSDVLLLSARYNNLKQELDQGFITPKEAKPTQNRIMHALSEMTEKAFKLDLLNGQAPESEIQERKLELVKEANKKTTILFLSANPEGTQSLRIDKELREIEEVHKQADDEDQFILIKKGAVRLDDLKMYLLEYEPDILHFSGHGTREGLLLVDDQDQKQEVENDALSRLMKMFQTNLKCVLLNSCYSQIQGALISQYIPHVIGMYSAVPDSSAIAFARSFYQAMFMGKSVDFAFDFAKLSLDLAQLKGTQLPVLLSSDIASS